VLKLNVYIYIYSLESQITVYTARHRVRIFFSYTPSTGWCFIILWTRTQGIKTQTRSA